MTRKLRELVASLAEADLSLLIKVAFEGINDCDAMKEISGILNMKRDDLLAFGQRVVDPLVTPADVSLGWYSDVPTNT